MSAGSRTVAAVLLREHGRTYAAEAHNELAAADDAAGSGVFRLLCLSLLLSARIRAEVAVRAAVALADAGWTTAAAMAASSWEDRTATLNRAGYARYDEKTARMLGAAAERILTVDGGNLDGLRGRAEYDPARERALLQDFHGIGPVGASIFAREAQAVWLELFPFADDRALATAKKLSLPSSAERLAALVDDPPAMAQLVAGLVRCGLAHDEGRILDLARSATE